MSARHVAVLAVRPGDGEDGARPDTERQRGGGAGAGGGRGVVPPGDTARPDTERQRGGGAGAGGGRGVVPPGGEALAPPGIAPGEFRLALLEDTYEVAAGLDLVTPVLVLDPPDQPEAEAITWPGTPIVREPTLAGAYAALHDLGATEAVLLAPDAPDLPPLLIGKLFRALGRAPASACQADGGGLVALAARLPLPDWLAVALKDVDLDTPDALARLRAAAPRPGLIPQGPGWHRLRTPSDVELLDPGLEGWENTRALLEGRPLGY